MPTPSEYLAAARVVAKVAEDLAPAAESLNTMVFKHALSEIFRHPPKLADALPRLAEAFEVRGEIDASLHLPEFAKVIKSDSAVGGTRITRFLGVGGGDFAVATDRGTALKIGDEALVRPVPNPAFDAPVLAHGQLGEKTFFYEQALGDTANVTDGHVVDVVKRLRANGYVEDDIWSWGKDNTRREQVALFGKAQRPLLIDQGCAIPRYGFTYQNGRLVANAQQRENLVAMRSFLEDKGISLNKRALLNPENPTRTDYKILSAQMTDTELNDAVRAHLTGTGKQPTLQPEWDYNEIHLGLQTLSLK